ncbi:MAG: Flp pilus assembly complex ATPase component TadA [Oscillatoriophycideae cyanobacterium NC_groundwater_1537_Pr4_S-0.65um_50_18]|nr:Flp pilus assembly complex ATPase component TadA [Oscillatoriophycideae cyanobacterium NC_groundwater_1537_Pr4_S-0.65um_50_18]
METFSDFISSRTAPDHIRLPVWRSLIRSGYATFQQLQQAWQTSQALQCSIFETLETVVGKSLSAQQINQYRQQERLELKILYGVECFDPARHTVDFSWIYQCLQHLIPLHLCDYYHLVPLRQDSTDVSQLWVGMIDPSNLEATNSLNYIFQRHGLVLCPMVITAEDYYHLVHQILDRGSRSVASSSDVSVRRTSGPSGGLRSPQRLSSLPLPKLEDSLPDLEALELQGFDLSSLPTPIKVASPEVDLSASLQAATSHPVVSLVNVILYKALKEGASDIHFEPQETSLQIRFRKDGILSVGWPPLPSFSIPAIISRIKILANLDIAERRIPQDGQISLKLQDQKVGLRVSTLPTSYGEKVVLRVLRSGTADLMLDTLITDATVLQQLRNMARSPFGLILVTGPTGSGKSTTLYATLAEKNSPHINICTVEDPIEYTLPGISQVQVMREKGLDFPKVLRALLRQDPDVILVGEVRDQETAKVTIETALTGHLVFSTLHTNDAPTTVTRLQELGIEPFRLASCLLGILSQRLVRHVCPKCREPYRPTASDLQSLRQFNLSCPTGLIYRARTLSSEDIQNASAQGKDICSTCKGTGYHGRLGVYELMVMDRNLKGLILEGASVDQLRDTARSAGMKTLADYSLQLVAQGMTTLEEVERVVLSSLAETPSKDECANFHSISAGYEITPTTATTAKDAGSAGVSADERSQQLMALIQNILNHPVIPAEDRLRWSSQVLNIIQSPYPASPVFPKRSPIHLINKLSKRLANL